MVSATTGEILIIILVPLFLFLLTAIILWIIIPPNLTTVPVIPIQPIIPPVGPTGITGSTGFTGMTGGVCPPILRRVLKDNLKISHVDPGNVADITSIDNVIYVLKSSPLPPINNIAPMIVNRMVDNQLMNQALANNVAINQAIYNQAVVNNMAANQALANNTDRVIGGQVLMIDDETYDLPVSAQRIAGFNHRLLVLDDTGKLWYTRYKDGELSRLKLLEDVNSKGVITWISTTIDQEHLWVAFRALPGQMQGSILYNNRLEIVDSSTTSENRIYGTNIHCYATISNNIVSYQGQNYANNAAAALDTSDNLVLIPTRDSPPLRNLRIVDGCIYTLIYRGSNAACLDSLYDCHDKDGCVKDFTINSSSRDASYTCSTSM